MLTEVGALNECQPTAEKHPRNTFSPEDNVLNSRGHTQPTMAPYSYPAAAGERYVVADFPNIDKPVETMPGPTEVSGKHSMSTNDLLLFQMAYIHQPHVTLPTGPAETNILHPATTSTDNSYSTPGSESFINNDNIASFWSDIPAAFR